MVNKLLSDFETITEPSYLPDTFTPYLSIILVIITFTMVTFSVQTIFMNSYADTPAHMKQLLSKANPCILQAHEYPDQYIVACAPQQVNNAQQLFIQVVKYVLQSPIK